MDAMGWDCETAGYATKLIDAGHDVDRVIGHIEAGYPLTGWID